MTESTTAAHNSSAAQQRSTEDLQRQYDAAQRRLATLVEKNRGLQQELSTASRNNRRMVELLNTTREEITTLKDALAQSAEPPFSFATVLEVHEARTPQEGREVEATCQNAVDLMYNGRKIRTGVSPLIEYSSVTAGAEVLLDESLNVISVLDNVHTGDLLRVKEVLDNGMLVTISRADDERVIRRTASLKDTVIRVGDAVTVDLRSGYALDVVPMSEVQDVVLEEVPDVTYHDVGGLGQQIEQIRDAVELPFTHPDIYREHGLKAPKGILLYGPPGTGKTMIAKAVASSLAERAGSAAQSYFLNIKGPELLNKFVGETERHIRTIFSRAREKATDGYPVVVFFDEMESLFRTRGSGVSSDVETTIVPQLLAEIDGVERLDNVIVIGASNREDMIDPAILRPGRLDVKIRVDRPDQAGAEDIFSKYISNQVPVHPAELAEHDSAEAAIKHMISTTADFMFSRTDQTRHVQLTYEDGTTSVLYYADFASGAAIANIVDRAKKYAIKDYLAAPQIPASGQDIPADKGLKTEHLIRAVVDEFHEQRDLPNTSSPEEWARISGHRGRRVVALHMFTNNAHDANEQLEQS